MAELSSKGVTVDNAIRSAHLHHTVRCSSEASVGCRDSPAHYSIADRLLPLSSSSALHCCCVVFRVCDERVLRPVSSRLSSVASSGSRLWSDAKADWRDIEDRLNGRQTHSTHSADTRNTASRRSSSGNRR